MTNPLPSILHLGCGRNKIADSLGVDIAPSPAVDLIWDLNKIPWPLPTASFDKVYLIDVLEHLDNVISVMEEVHRVSKEGATVFIQSPFASSFRVWADPSHRRGFTSTSFRYFTAEFCAAHFEYSKARFRVRHVEYRVCPSRWYDRLIAALANRFKTVYEKRFLYWFPLDNIYFELVVEKSAPTEDGGPRP